MDEAWVVGCCLLGSRDIPAFAIGKGEEKRDSLFFFPFCMIHLRCMWMLYVYEEI